MVTILDLRRGLIVHIPPQGTPARGQLIRFLFRGTWDRDMVQA